MEKRKTRKKYWACRLAVAASPKKLKHSPRNWSWPSPRVWSWGSTILWALCSLVVRDTWLLGRVSGLRMHASPQTLWTVFTHCGSAINQVGNGQSQFLGSWVINWILTTVTRLVQWLSWVFVTHERKKERFGELRSGTGKQLRGDRYCDLWPLIDIRSQILCKSFKGLSSSWRTLLTLAMKSDEPKRRKIITHKIGNSG